MSVHGRRQRQRADQVSSRDRLAQVRYVPRTLKLVCDAAPLWAAISRSWRQQMREARAVRCRGR